MAYPRKDCGVVSSLMTWTEIVLEPFVYSPFHRLTRLLAPKYFTERNLFCKANRQVSFDTVLTRKLFSIIFPYIPATLEKVKRKSSTPQCYVQPKLYVRYDSLTQWALSEKTNNSRFEMHAWNSSGNIQLLSISSRKQSQWVVALAMVQSHGHSEGHVLRNVFIFSDA